MRERFCMARHLTLATALFLATASCTHRQPARDDTVSLLISERLTDTPSLNSNSSIDCLIDLLLEHELSPRAAVQIALLNNPELKASLESLGIARADLVQAGLLQNPLFTGLVRFAESGDAKLNTEFSVTQNFIDLFLIPLREKAAKTELEVVELQVANAVIHLAFEVKKAFFTLQKELTTLQLRREIAEIASLEYEIAERQFDAGNCPELQLEQYASKYQKMLFKTQQCALSLQRLEKKFSDLLGLRLGSWGIHPELKELQSPVFPENIVSIALKGRLDLLQLQKNRDRIIQLGATKGWWSYTDATLGISRENDIEGSSVLGPAFAFNLPLFDTGQAARARLHAERRQTEHKIKALENTICTEMLQAMMVVHTLEEQIEKQQLEIEKRALKLSKELYSVMGIDVYKLLDAKIRETEARIAYNRMLGHFWSATVEVERALGRSLDS